MAGRDEASKGPQLKFLEDRWDEDVAAGLDGPELLRYRSNLLGSDLRITNFGGGNTSSKLDAIDPLTGKTTTVLWVKGSGGDLGSIRRAGFATLYFEGLLALERIYRGVAEEDSMAGMYPLLTFNNNPTVASIDTPLHGFLPFAHVDHLHPDWGIALAASANGRQKMEEFNAEFGHKLAWLPWQRPGFELGLMLRRIVAETPGCDGVVLGGHGLFTWGETQRASYLSTITIIDQIGQFIERHTLAAGGEPFGGAKVESHERRAAIAAEVMPCLRGAVSRKQRSIGGFTDDARVLRFVNSASARALARLGTSCPDHFIRTKIRPMFVDWDPATDAAVIPELIERSLETYRVEYAAYYAKYAVADSPKQRDASPTVVLLPGVGMFTFGRNKTDARLTGEFYINAIGVMQGAGALGAGVVCDEVPQAGPAASADQFGVCENYVALPPGEAFRIEYWVLEDAKLRRQPAEKQLSRRVALIVGCGEVGAQAAVIAAERGAHVMAADWMIAKQDVAGAERVAAACRAIAGKDAVAVTAIGERESIRAAVDATVKQFGGVDVLIVDIEGALSSNVAVDDLLAEAGKVFEAQGLDASVVVVDSVADEVCEVSKALGERVRELGAGMGPKVRMNGVCVSVGAARDGAEAALFLAGPLARGVTGQIIAVGGGVVEGSR